VNYKRKSRRRFFLLMRSRTPPISSEFRGGGCLNTPNPPSVRHWSRQQDICSVCFFLAPVKLLGAMSRVPRILWSPNIRTVSTNACNLCLSWCTPSQSSTLSRGELSYLAPLGSENISAPYLK